MIATLRDLCIDANDPAVVGAFWGAVVLREPGEERWWVLADPEGHEFCAFPPETVATNDEDAEVAV